MKYISSNIEKLQKTYSKIYDLPIVSFDYEVTNLELLRATETNFFISVAMYDNEKHLYFAPKYKVPDIKDHNYIHSAVENAANSSIFGVKLGEIEPVTLITHNFWDNSGNKHTQFGLGFMGRIRNPEKLHLDNYETYISVPNNDTNEINYLSSKNVLAYCMNRLNKLNNQDIQTSEIDTNEKMQLRYLIHKEVVKRFILTNKRKNKKGFTQLLSRLMNGYKTILDASCGDSQLLTDIVAEKGNNIDFAVGNDISWSQVSLIKNKNENISFTNHDSTNLPFSENAFGVAICCNTLHHMPSEKHLAKLFQNLIRVAEKVIIVEIENPQNTGGFPKLLNKYYYEGFLQDVGERYLSQEEFRLKVEENSKDAKVRFSNFKNIQGNYMIAEIEKNKKTISK